MQTLRKPSFKKIILTLSLVLFVSVNVDAVSLHALPAQGRTSISFIDHHNAFSAYEPSKVGNNEVSMTDAKFRFTSKDYLLCVLLLGVYIMLVRKKSNSRNADF